MGAAECVRYEVSSDTWPAPNPHSTTIGNGTFRGWDFTHGQAS